jgi:hypothetical protein
LLHLKRLDVQLGASSDSTGVLHNCTALTALGLQYCRVDDASGGAAAIAALPELQRLSLSGYANRRCSLLAQLQYPLQLTSLFLKKIMNAEEAAGLSQLSGLTNLRDINLIGLPAGGLPGGLPSQLVKLTYLWIDCRDWGRSGTAYKKQFQHLSSLTALRHLSVQNTFPGLKDVVVSGTQHLPQLKSLKLQGSAFLYKWKPAPSALASSHA